MKVLICSLAIAAVAVLAQVKTEREPTHIIKFNDKVNGTSMINSFVISQHRSFLIQKHARRQKRLLKRRKLQDISGLKGSEKNVTSSHTVTNSSHTELDSIDLKANSINEDKDKEKSEEDEEEDEDDEEGEDDEDEEEDDEEEDEDDEYDEDEDDEYDIDSHIYSSNLEHQLSLELISIDNNFVAISGVFKDSKFINYLHSQPSIDYIEPNYLYKADILMPQDNYDVSHIVENSLAFDWGLSRISQRNLGILNTYSYNTSAGSGVHVYVLDTGINTDHDDFENRASVSANFVSNEASTDMGGHGTHVAGKIGGRVYGVAKGVTLHAVKILGKNGEGSTSNLLRGVSHVIESGKSGKTIINLSLSGPRSRLIDEIINKATLEHNIPIFVSAGNAGADACTFSPSSNENVFVVGATNSKDEVPYYSNLGQCVHMYAPGSNIKSTWVGASDAVHILDGTSMACPHVTGIAASLLSKNVYDSVHDLYDDLYSVSTKDILKFNTQKPMKSNHNALAYNTVDTCIGL
ncbi:peptidase S8/S53 domain-containing protein [Spinellus fusiger]|nr:peptidase S8/S53 domain-containing protein [Spinellus fusiger]